MSIGSMQMLERAAYKELATINDVLAPAGIVNEVDGLITKEQLNRAEAQTTERTEMSTALSTNDTEVVAAAARAIHEATRVRRDINIAQATHKQLLLGAYRTLYQRKLKLESDIQEGHYA